MEEIPALALPATKNVCVQRSRWLALPFILVGPFLSLFDQFVVNLAATSINHSLHLSALELQAVIGGYGFTYGLGLILGGQLGDAYGRRRLYRTGLVMFGITSLVCGLAQNSEMMVAARLLQGVSAAVLLPQVLALIRVMFPAEERPRALSWFVVSIGLGMALGQLLGGAIPGWDLFGWSWRPIFLVAVPLCLMSWLACGWLVSQDAPTTGKPDLDLVGLTLLAVGYGLVLLPLAGLQEIGFWPLGLSGIALGLGLLAVFVRRQIMLTQVGRQALVPMFLFRSPAFVVGVLLNFTLYAASVPFFFLLGLYLRESMGLSPTMAGLAFSPIALAIAGGSRVSPALTRRFGSKIPIGSAVMTTLGLAGSSFALAGLGHTMAAMVLLEVSIVVFGLGNGITVPIVTGVVLAELPPERAGAGAAILTSAQQLAGVAGVAATGAVVFAQGSSVDPRFTPGFLLQVVFACLSLGCAILLVARSRT